MSHKLGSIEEVKLVALKGISHSGYYTLSICAYLQVASGASGRGKCSGSRSWRGGWGGRGAQPALDIELEQGSNSDISNSRGDSSTGKRGSSGAQKASQVCIRSHIAARFRQRVLGVQHV